MSIKKAISLSFLFLVNIAILAHSVVYHHHNDQIFSVLCTANQGHHCDGTAHEHHSHDTESPSKCCAFENCLLNTLYTKADDFKLTKSIFEESNFDINTFIVNQTIQIADLSGLPFRQNPDLLLLYSEYLSQSIGLRAPPTC